MLQIILLSFTVSLTATLISAISGVWLGVVISLHNFRFKQLVIAIVNTWMSIPAILIGLLIYILFNREGIFGFLELLFTPIAIVIGQTVLATPIVCALTISGLKSTGKEIKETALSLGATNFQAVLTLLKESKFAIFQSVITAFARIIGETGCAIIVGGNIKGYTQVMSTAIAIETLKGNFEFAIQLGIILFVIALVLNFILQLITKISQV